MRKRVAVFGLGYVGLPLVRACINAGDIVVGVDIDNDKVATLRAGVSYVDDVRDFEVEQWLASGFIPTTEASHLIGIDVFVICVPTPLSESGGPDLGAVEEATRAIEACLPEASTVPLVVLESTTYPGTTEEVVKPILEGDSRRAGIDFHLAFSPERIDPGNKIWTFENTPKVVGGFTESCSTAAKAFYARMTTRVVTTKGLKEAEMAKLLENTYRHVNIALVNELAKLCHELGIDIWNVIGAAETKPYGFQAFKPGPGVGGHCIPIDPNYLGHRVKSQLGQPFRFVELAQEINASMPYFIIQRAQEMLNEEGKCLKGSQILLLGITYKRDIADLRESPAIPIIKGLLKRGALVMFHDPYIDSVTIDGQQIMRTDYRDAAIEAADLVVLLQDHSVYNGLVSKTKEGRLLNTRGASG